MTVLEIDRTKYFNDNSSNKDEQKNWVVVSNGINTKTLVVMVLSVSCSCSSSSSSSFVRTATAESAATAEWIHRPQRGVS